MRGGSHSEARILELIKAQGNDEAFAYFETKYRNQPWHVLTVGQFGNRESALTVIAKLSPGLQAHKILGKKRGEYSRSPLITERF